MIAIPVIVDGELIPGKRYTAVYSASSNAFTITVSQGSGRNKKPKQPPIPKWMRRK